MTNEEKINLIGQKILILSNNLEKYQAELNALKLQLAELQKTQPSTVANPAPHVEPQQKLIVEETVAAPEITTAPVTPAPPPVQPMPKTKSAAGFNFEEFIGGKLISIIGIVVLIIGLGIGVKYAIDRDLINPLTRIVLAYTAGAILLLIAFRLKQKFKPFSAVLLSGAMASLYFTTFIAYSMYDMFPRALCFAIMLVFTAFTVFAATIYALEVIGVIGLVGAYAVPLLLSDGTGRIEVMFAYMLIINAGILVLSFKKYWQVLNHFAFWITWLVVSCWMAFKYDHGVHVLMLLGFSFAFFLIFYISNMAYKIVKHEKFGVADVIRLLSNSFIFFGIGYAALNNGDYKYYLGLFTVANALIHLIFSYIVFRNKLLDRNLFFLLIALVLTFITIAVPVQLNGNWVTLIWSSEAALLFIIGRNKNVRFYEWLGLGMLLLSAFSLLTDWASYYEKLLYTAKTGLSATPFFNINFLTSLLFDALLAAMIRAHFKKPQSTEGRNHRLMAGLSNYALPAILFIFVYFTFYNEIVTTFKLLFRRSEITADPDYYGERLNFAFSYFGTIAVHCYTMLFFIVTTVLVMRKWQYDLIRWIAFGFNMLVALYFIFDGLDTLSRLRDHYLNPELNSYFTTSYWEIDVRYLCFALLAALLYATHLLLKKETFRRTLIARFYDGCIVHFFILVLLSAELINISILHNYTKEYNYYSDTHTAYKLGLTCVWGIYSFLLIALGIFRRNRIMRVSAISLFGITLVKLVTYDTWDLSTGYKIIAFILLGVILLTVAFLYQKFKQLIFGDDQPETPVNPTTHDEN